MSGWILQIKACLKSTAFWPSGVAAQGKSSNQSGQCWKLLWHQRSAPDIINWGQTSTTRSRCDRRPSTLVPLGNGQESLPFMAAPSTLEEITLFVFARKADWTPVSQGQTGWCSLWTCNCTLGGFWFSVKCQYFLWKEAHLFSLFLTKKNLDVCDVLLNYPYCTGKNRAKPALECKSSIFPSIFGNLQTRQPWAVCNFPQDAGSFAGRLCLSLLLLAGWPGVGKSSAPMGSHGKAIALCNRATAHLKFQSSFKTQHHHRRVWMELFPYLPCKCLLAQPCYPLLSANSGILSAGLPLWSWKMYTQDSQRNLSRQPATPRETTYCRNEKRSSTCTKKSTPRGIPAFGIGLGRPGPANLNTVWS